MKKISFIKKFLSVELVLLILGLTFLYTFKRKEKATSTNVNVNKAIASIDYSINMLGTDEDLIFDTFKGLNLLEIKLLFKDFGTRFYNELTGEYILFSILSGWGASKELDLKGLLLAELNDSEIEDLTEILLEKNYVF